ncbi:hypothetical protein CHCC14814_2721 [Bacillus paralicheniformis]|nr:hypothetical protein CHCC14814_2721 [Bacillus paralicheniformis]
MRIKVCIFGQRNTDLIEQNIKMEFQKHIFKLIGKNPVVL